MHRFCRLLRITRTTARTRVEIVWARAARTSSR